MSNYIKEILTLIDSFIDLSSETNVILNTQNGPISENLINETALSDAELVINPESISEAPISNTDVINEPVIILFNEKSEQLLLNIFRLFNFSILSGEYIANSNLKNELDLIIQKQSEVLNLTNLFSEEIQKQVTELTGSVNLSTKIYQIFLNEIQNRFSEDSIDYLFSFHDTLRKEINNQKLEETHFNLVNYFSANINLSRTDHFFSGDDSQFEALYKLEHRFNNLYLPQLDDITNVIKFKIGFLEHKWKARKQQELYQSIYFNVDGNTETLDEFESDDLKIKEWLQIIDSQYELNSSWKHDLTHRVRKYKSKALNELTYLQIHQIIKYYKDVNKNLRKLIEIRDYLLNIPETSLENSYDKYVLNVMRNYAINNTFSLASENKNIEVITKAHKSAKEKTKEGVVNFFLDFKYLNKTIDLLLKQIEDGDKIEFINNYENFITKKCEKTLKAYKSSKDLSKIHTNYIFLLPYSESLVESSPILLYPNSEISLSKVFYASSFVLPKINDKIESTYIEIETKFRSISLQIEIIKRFRKDLENINKVSEDVQKRDLKSVEIISIFTAIITFVLSSIPAFKFVTNVSQAILFMLALASALGIFVLLVLFSVNVKRKLLFAGVNVSILIGLAVFTFYSLGNYEKTQQNIDERVKIKIDSLINVKTDSLLKLKEIKLKVNPSLEVNPKLEINSYNRK